MRAVLAVVAAAVIGTAAVIVAAGTDPQTRLSGSNGIDAATFSVVLPDGKQHCQQAFVPGNTDRLQMTIGSYDRPMPPIDVTIEDPAGRTVVRTRAPALPDQGVVPVELGRVVRDPVDNATVCLRPRGTRIALGGVDTVARMAWLRPGRESYFGITATIVHRFGLGKGGVVGSWAAWLAIALVAAVWVIAARLVVREAVRR